MAARAVSASSTAMTVEARSAEKSSDSFRGKHGHLAAALGGLLPAGVFRQDLPHQIRGYTEKMRTIRIVRMVLADQPQVHFVHERCRLQGVIRPFVPQVAGGYFPQLAVNQGNEFI